MKIGIGIDTGGTYTDAVLFDFEQKKIISKNKALTTKEDLSIGIKNAIDALPYEILKNASILSVSTTLATNACVEKKGGRAKLVLIGTNKSILEWIDAKKHYGLDDDDLLCVETIQDKDTNLDSIIDWGEILLSNEAWFDDAQSLAIVAKNAVFNGAIIEKEAKEKILKKHCMPFIMASEVADNINMMERGATALLNARLLSIVEEFIEAVHVALSSYNLNIKKMIVRSDGSLMSEAMILKYPVKTILSGPAASVMGAMALTECENSLIIDMGGTTTDISVVENKQAAMTNGILIGGYKTQIKGVFIDTFALGGDTRITIQEGKIVLDTRRVVPLCALAKKFPNIKDHLKALINDSKRRGYSFHEFLYLVKEPKNVQKYEDYEVRIIKLLQNGPVIISGGDFDLYNLKIDRLESEGVVIRSGLTPTDIMHLNGDFLRYDKQASELASEYILEIVPELKKDINVLVSTVYDLVGMRLYEGIVRTLLKYRYSNIFKNGIDAQLSQLIGQSWIERNKNTYFSLGFTTKPVLVGIGAPIHVFLPEVAKALNTECIIPENAEVANALGAIIADVSVEVQSEVYPIIESSVISGYEVRSREGIKKFETEDSAIAFAKNICEKLAMEEAKNRGAPGELSIDTKVENNVAYSKEGHQIPLSTAVIVKASGRL